MWEALKILNHLYFLTLVGSLLSMLTLRILTGSTSTQIDLIGEYRTSVERTTRNCLNARSLALSLESNGAQTLRLVRSGNVVSIRDPSLLIRPTVEEADQLMRTLTTLPKRCGEMRVSHLRRNLRTLKRVEHESAKLLVKLETARRWCSE
ncbi:MAG: hypothetical protein EON58_18225 [Alphaproteobacteria bacterium]|nr:MAG: hypothetical protein EON58_18225 [Alphaproteobacteria bacterium]